MFTDTRPAAKATIISDSVNYSDMAKKSPRSRRKRARMTVEALANDLAEICLQEAGVVKVIVRVEKPEAVEAGSVAVEVEREKGSSTRLEPRERLIICKQ